MSPFTQGYIQEEDMIKAKWLSARKAITYMMKSWTGLICLANDGIGITSLVDALKLPDKDNQRQVRRRICKQFLTFLLVFIFIIVGNDF